MAQKRTGRPTKPPTDARVQLSMRVTADVKRKLDAAADANDRTQSHEAEMRLERSFAADDDPGFARYADRLVDAFREGLELGKKQHKQLKRGQHLGDALDEESCYEVGRMFAEMYMAKHHPLRTQAIQTKRSEFEKKTVDLNDRYESNRYFAALVAGGLDVETSEGGDE